MPEPSLVLYTDSSPNGFKATIALEEMGLPYRLEHVRIEHGEHLQAGFLALNPAGRIPVLVDHGANIVLFESAAILLYLAQRSGQLLDSAPQPRWAAITWLMYHSASMGPLLGQRVHIATFAWLHIAALVGFDFSPHRHLTRWYQQVEQRPAVQRGIRLPAPATGP